MTYTSVSHAPQQAPWKGHGRRCHLIAPWPHWHLAHARHIQWPQRICWLSNCTKEALLPEEMRSQKGHVHPSWGMTAVWTDRRVSKAWSEPQREELCSDKMTGCVWGELVKHEVHIPRACPRDWFPTGGNLYTEHSFPGSNNLALELSIEKKLQWVRCEKTSTEKEAVGKASLIQSWKEKSPLSTPHAKLNWRPVLSEDQQGLWLPNDAWNFVSTFFFFSVPISLLISLYLDLERKCIHWWLYFEITLSKKGQCP